MQPEQPVDDRGAGQPDARLEVARPLPDRPGRAGDGVRQGDGRAVGRAGQGLGGADGHELVLDAGGRDLGRLERQDGIRAAALGGHEEVVEVLRGGLRVERHERVLELLGADRPGHVAGDEQERVADGDLAAPDVDMDLVARRQALATLLLGQRQEAGLAHEVGVGVADGRHVQLVAADDGDAGADGAGGQAVALARLAERLVGGPDRLLEADGDARRLVVVVAVADRVGHERGGLAGLATALGSNGHDAVEVALRAAH